MAKLLFIGANPASTSRLAQDEELRALTEAIQLAGGSLSVVSGMAARYDDVLVLLDDHKPDIVHISAHSDKHGQLILVDSDREVATVPPDLLAHVFRELGERVRLVVLSGCDTQLPAQLISQSINCVVATQGQFDDDSALAFVKPFYRALAAGKPIQDAFKLARLSLLQRPMESQAESLILLERRLGVAILACTTPRRAFTTPRPDYPSDRVRQLSEQLEQAYARKQHLEDAGVATADVRAEILTLKRAMRGGGRLKAGDIIGQGQYLLCKQIGHGGFATVWEARDRTTGDQVAIKVLHPNLGGDPLRRDRFFRGARRMEELNHNGVVRILSAKGEDDDYYYFVMELAHGGTLHDAVLAGRIEPAAAVPQLLKIGEALAEAHQRGWVHRDIKPTNILLTESGEPRLTDFDLVKDGETTGGTRTGAMGTFVYAAPEMMERPQDAGAPADVFGLAMTAAFVLHGDKLPSRTVLRDPEGFVDQLDCTSGVKAVLKRAVAWEASERYPDASAFCEALAVSAWAPTNSTDEPARGTRRVERATRMTLLWLPGGTFTMGDDHGPYDDEKPAHVVTVSSFWIGETVVTNQQYQEFVAATGREPAAWDDEDYNGSAQPVVGVSWYEAVAYCNYLSEQNNLTPCYRIKENQIWWESWDGYRLPTEAEWEFACRAGTQMQYSFGDDAEELGEYAWFDKNSERKLQLVATRKPNPWGLYDMHGNVWEWCWDTFADYPGTSSSESWLDPAGPTGQLDDYKVDTDNLRKLLRGGSFVGRAEVLRSVIRDWGRPGDRFWDSGFRCVRGVRRQP